MIIAQENQITLINEGCEKGIAIDVSSKLRKFAFQQDFTLISQGK